MRYLLIILLLISKQVFADANLEEVFVVCSENSFLITPIRTHSSEYEFDYDRNVINESYFHSKNIHVRNKEIKCNTANNSYIVKFKSSDPAYRCGPTPYKSITIQQNDEVLFNNINFGYNCYHTGKMFSVSKVIFTEKNKADFNTQICTVEIGKKQERCIYNFGANEFKQHKPLINAALLNDLSDEEPKNYNMPTSDTLNIIEKKVLTRPGIRTNTASQH